MRDRPPKSAFAAVAISSARRFTSAASRASSSRRRARSGVPSRASAARSPASASAGLMPPASCAATATPAPWPPPRPSVRRPRWSRAGPARSNPRPRRGCASARRGGCGGMPTAWRGVARRSFTARQGGVAAGHSPGSAKAAAARRISAQARGPSTAASSSVSASAALTVTLTPAGRTSTHCVSPPTMPMKRTGPVPRCAKCRFRMGAWRSGTRRPGMSRATSHGGSASTTASWLPSASVSSPRCSAVACPSATVSARSREPNRTTAPAARSAASAGATRSGPSPSRATSSRAAPRPPRRRITAPSRAEDASATGVFSAATVSGSMKPRSRAGCFAKASATGRSPRESATRSSASIPPAFIPGGRTAASRQASGAGAMRCAWPSARSSTGSPAGSGSTQPSSAPICARNRSAAWFAPISAWVPLSVPSGRARQRPPAIGVASCSTTPCPSRARASAATSPATPAPTTCTVGRAHRGATGARRRAKAAMRAFSPTVRRGRARGGPKPRATSRSKMRR